MFRDFPDDREYKVVINHEEQYSLWPAEKGVPRGWKEVGRTGSKKICLAYVDEVWTDSRPLSLHTQMAKDISQMR